MSDKEYTIKVIINVNDQDEYVIETRTIRFADSEPSLNIIDKLINKISEKSDRIAYRLDYLREEDNL